MEASRTTLPWRDGAHTDRRKNPSLNFADPELVDKVVQTAYEQNQLSELRTFCKELTDRISPNELS